MDVNKFYIQDEVSSLLNISQWMRELFSSNQRYVLGRYYVIDKDGYLITRHITLDLFNESVYNLYYNIIPDHLKNSDDKYFIGGVTCNHDLEYYIKLSRDNGFSGEFRKKY